MPGSSAWQILDPARPCRGTLRFLAPSGERHEAAEHRIELEPAPVGARVSTEFEGGRFTLRSEPRGDGSVFVRCCVHNTTDAPAGLDRGGALARSLISTQLVVRISAGSFRSPLDGAPTSVNTYPVLATEADDAVLGTSYALPDHPQIAPESRGALFDSTEIEEALLLHVQVLSDDERAEIEQADPAVREMIARAAAATPEDIIALHGRVEIRDPETPAPPSEPPGLPDPAAGQPEAIVDGVRFARGLKVVIRPGPDADFHARMLDGRTATIERILTDYDGKTHLGVTIDDDPGQDLMRETGRLLYFFAPEVEVIDIVTEDQLRSILIAGVGNAWLRDDGFGGEVARQLADRALPEGVAVMDAGTGGLDLAYEVMRGYDALVILDVSKQGGEPGTLYVMEPDEESVPGGIEDGDVINPHGMDPQTVLRFVKSVGAWPGRVMVIACEPADVEEMGWGLSDEVRDAVARAVDLVVETVAELQSGAFAAPAE